MSLVGNPFPIRNVEDSEPNWVCCGTLEIQQSFVTVELASGDARLHILVERVGTCPLRHKLIEVLLSKHPPVRFMRMLKIPG